jgi:hypothetical protein
MVSWSADKDFFLTIMWKKKWVFIPHLFFLCDQKSINVHHSIKVSLKIFTNKLQDQIQLLHFYQLTRNKPNFLL